MRLQLYIGLQDSLLRPLVVTVLGISGNSAVVAEAQQLFANYLSSLNGATPNQIPTELRGPVFKIVLKNANESTLNLFLSVLTKLILIILNKVNYRLCKTKT